MCALYTLKVSYQDILQSLGFAVEVAVPLGTDDLDQRFLPHQTAPIVRFRGDRYLLEMMNFSLIPHWSKERRPKFATHNARIETLPIKPTWKKPLQNNHCLIPLSEFIEPIYEGPHAGHMLGFSQRDDQILWAAGLWDEWIDLENGLVVPSFTIITHEPSTYVRAMGHDREPLFLNQRAFETWLRPAPKKTTDWLSFLKEAHQEPPLKVREDRRLKNHRPN